MHRSARPIRRLAAPLLGLALLAADAAADDAVTLRFAWPDDLGGVATFTFRLESQQDDGPKQILEASGAMRLSTSAVAGDLILDIEDRSVVIDSHSADDASRQLAAVITPLSLRRPDTRVSRSGDFLGLHDAEAFMAEVRSGIDAGTATMSPELLAVARPSIIISLSQQQFSSVAARAWDQEVGRWIDRTLQPGSPVITDEMLDFPGPGGGRVPARVSHRLLGQVPCGTGAGSCVELEVRTVFDGPELTAAYRQALLAQGAAGIDVSAYRFEIASRLITDPETLVPYRNQVSWQNAIDVMSGSTTIAVRDAAEHTTIYNYD